MDLALGIIIGLVLGGGVTYALLRSGSVRLETQLVERTHQLETTVRERDEARAERDTRARELAQAAAEISGYKSTQAARDKALEERRAELGHPLQGARLGGAQSSAPRSSASRRPNSSSTTRSWPART